MMVLWSSKIGRVSRLCLRILLASQIWDIGDGRWEMKGGSGEKLPWGFKPPRMTGREKSGGYRSMTCMFR